MIVGNVNSRQVLEVLSSLYGKEESELADILFKNTCSVFNLHC